MGQRSLVTPANVAEDAGAIARAAALLRRLDGWTVGVLLTGYAVLLTLGLWLIARLKTTGDEPWYLLQTYSLLHWHTANLAAAVTNHHLYTQFLGTAPDDHTRDYLGNGERVLVNMPGYAAAIAPFYAIGGRPLVVAFQALVAAITGTLVFSQVRSTFGSRTVALLGWLAYLVPLPVLLYAGQIFPSTLATCALFLGFVLVTRWLPGASGRRLVLVGGAIGVVVFVLPWLHLKYALPALVLAGLALLTLRSRLRWRTGDVPDRHAWWAAGVLAGLSVLSFALIAIYSHHFFGSWTPPNAEEQPDLLHPHLSNVLSVYGDMLFGPQSGLIPWVPLDLLVPLGLVLLVRRFPRQGRAMLALLLVQLGAFVTAAVTPVFQGKALPARFTVECAPFFALCVAAVFAAGAEPVRTWLGSGVAHDWRTLARAGRDMLATHAWSGAWRSRLVTGRAVWTPVAGVALVLLLATGWFTSVGQRDPLLLYPGPSGPRVVAEYANALPSGWFALFPSPPEQWVTAGTAAFDPRRSPGLPVHDADGTLGFLTLPNSSPRTVVLARSQSVLLPPGQYLARIRLGCDQPRHPAVAGRLLARRARGGRAELVARLSFATSVCRGTARSIWVTLPFPSDGYRPTTFEVDSSGTTALVAWSVAYAPDLRTRL